MAYDNKEIEIKIKLDAPAFAAARSKVKAVAALKGVTTQVDTYFAPQADNYLLETFPYKWLSLRERGDKCILNFKHFFPEGAEIHTHCTEFETEVTRPSSLISIFRELNIVEVVKVHKQRELYIYCDLYAIALDTVKSLGCYLEVEALKELGTPETTKRQMFEFLSGLGIDQFELEYRGYPFRMLELQKRP